MSKAAVLALVVLVTAVAAGLATARSDSSSVDTNPCGTATAPEDRTTDVDDDADVDCETQAQALASEHITICHALGNGGYNQISPDVNGVLNGHDGHDDDIIPPFDYDDKGQTKHYPGKNWDAEGQAIFDNGCEIPPPTPTCPSKATITATDSTGQGSRNQYTYPEHVYARGDNMPANTTLQYTVVHNNGGETVASGSAASGSGNFTTQVWDGANAFPGDEGYTVTFSTTGCSRGDQFQYRRDNAPPAQVKLRVRKTVVGSDKPKSDFSFRVNGGPPTAFEADGENELTLDPGTYSVTEDPVSGFTTSLDGCTGIVLTAPQQSIPVCTITNTANSVPLLKLRVKKGVINSTRPATDFSFSVNGGPPTPFQASGENELTLPPGTYTITEVPVDGFTTTSAGCSDIQLVAPQTTIPLCAIKNIAKEDPPAPIEPVGIFVKCVDDAADGGFQATFGYDNKANAVDITIPVGAANNVNGDDRGQPSTFVAGAYVPSAFTTNGAAGSTITWSLTSGSPAGERTAAATADFPTKCSEPTPPPKPVVTLSVTCVENTGSTYTARFGYTSNAAVSLPIPQQNSFDPAPANRGQPEELLEGKVDDAVDVTGISNSVQLTWTVDAGNGTPPTATASASFGTKCSVEPPQPEPEPEPPQPEPIPPGPSLDPIGVFAQCVTVHGGTYDAVFGYQNDNEAAVEIPVGADNRFVPGGDRGQVTTFLPGSHPDAFTVAGIPSGSALAWVVTHAGATRFAVPNKALPACSEGPQPVQPVGVFACVVDHGNTFDAVFGYDNPNAGDVTAPIGLRNNMLPSPIDRGQPTVFSPGRHENAFVVRGVKSRVLAWTIWVYGGRTVVVTADYPVKCAHEERRPLVVFPLCVRRTGSTYTAVFGYANVNRLPVVLPVGRSNFVVPRPFDRGQPRIFRGGIAWHSFAVRKIPIRRAITWTVRDAGRVSRARATATLARSCATTPVDPDVRLEVDKSVDPNSATVGGKLVFRMVARNKGTTTSQQTILVDRRLDDLVAFLSATPSQGRCTVRRTVTCRLGALNPGATATVVVAARARAPGVSRDLAVLTSVPVDIGPDNVDRVTIVITSPLAAHRKPPFTG